VPAPTLTNLEPSVYTTPPAVTAKEALLVPPLAIGSAPVTEVVKSACPEVFTLLAN
jgi:hypothetical protein